MGRLWVARREYHKDAWEHPMRQVDIVDRFLGNVGNSEVACADIRCSLVLYFGSAERESVCRNELVAVVQSVEHLVVVQDVAGSSPVGHPSRRNDPVWDRFFVRGLR